MPAAPEWGRRVRARAAKPSGDVGTAFGTAVGTAVGTAFGTAFGACTVPGRAQPGTEQIPCSLFLLSGLSNALAKNRRSAILNSSSRDDSVSAQADTRH